MFKLNVNVSYKILEVKSDRFLQKMCGSPTGESIVTPVLSIFLFLLNFRKQLFFTVQFEFLIVQYECSECSTRSTKGVFMIEMQRGNKQLRNKERKRSGNCIYMYVVHVLTCVERDADRRSRSHSASSRPRRPPWTYWHLQWRCLWYLLST